MPMSVKTLSFKEDSLIRANLRYGAIGIVVGILLSVFISIFNNRALSAKNTLLNILFSFFISLSITNSVFIYECYLKQLTTSFWKYIAGYYSCNIIGNIIGTELSYLIVSAIFKTPYSISDHLENYKFNFFIVMIVGTLILLYQAQKVNMLSLLNAKEVDIVKINQLKIQAELQTLQSKINPHFLYNALNSIASLIHEDADKAEEMTLKLSKLFRYSINTMQESATQVAEEIEILNNYLDIEKIRFGDRIHFQIRVDESLEKELIPRFLIQPLVENALKHGLKDTTANGLLSVNISKDAAGILISIADNGIPFPAELNIGYGLQSTYDKLQLLYGEGYELKISNVPFKQISILLPFKEGER